MLYRGKDVDYHVVKHIGINTVLSVINKNMKQQYACVKVFS